MEYKGHGRWEQKRLPVEKPQGLNRMKKITYKSEYDEPAKKKPAQKKKPVKRKTTTSNVKPVSRAPKKKLPPMKKPGWFW